MKQQWERIAAKVLTLSRRERAMILAGMLAVIWVVFDTLLLTPALQKNKVYRQEIASKRDEMVKLQQQEVVLVKAAEADPDAGNKQHLADLQRKVSQMDTDLQGMQRDLIAPERMPRVLESLLRKDSHLKLVSLTTLPVSGLMDGLAADTKGGAVPAFGIYKHGFQVTLEGGYFDLVRYMEALEAAPWRMLWGDMELAAGAYPRSTLTLTLYTLSLDKAWLSI